MPVPGKPLLCLLLGLGIGGCHGNRDHGSTNKPADREAGVPLFVDVTAASGIDFSHNAGGARNYFFPAIMAPGGAFLDFDGDGDLDVLLVDSGNPPDPNVAVPKDAPSSCRLFRQDPGLQFVDVTSQSGLVHHEYGVGVAVGDVNNDGFPDVYFTNYGPDRLFVNRRDGTYSETTNSGIDNVRWSASAAFFDYDRDGWLDLFVTNYVDYDPARPCLTHSGRQDYCNPAQFPGTAAKLFRNVTGKRRAAEDAGSINPWQVAFEDVSLSAGIALKSAAGLGVVCADFNGDMWPDVYVANDGNPNFLWINQRDGTFREEAVLAGAAYDSLGRPQGSMGIAVGDVNSDQAPDLLVTNLDGENNALYLGAGDGSFREASAASGLGPSFPRTGFGTVFIDIDHDGDLDLLVANGRVRRAVGPSRVAKQSESLSFWQPYVESNDIFLNNGRGRFTLFAAAGDGFLAEPAVSRGLAAGDVDNDGDLDLLVTVCGGRARLLRNDASKRGHWLIVRTIDPRYGGRDAYGAQVTVVAGSRRWTAVVSPGSSYLVSHDPRSHFGLGDVTTVDAIEVLWPDGVRESFAGGSADQLRCLEFGSGKRE